MTTLEVMRWERWLVTEIITSTDPDSRAKELRDNTAREWQAYVDRARQYVCDVFLR